MKKNKKVQKHSYYNLSFRICAGALIVLHLTVFGPVRDVLAFSATSATYRLSSGSPSLGGNSRTSNTKIISQDTIGESCALISTSTNYILSSGFVATLQSLPPGRTAKSISSITWEENKDNSNALNLDEYFIDPEGEALTYTWTYAPDSSQKVAAKIDDITHKVSFYPSPGWFGNDKIIFTATNSGGETAKDTFFFTVTRVDLPPEIIEIKAEKTEISEGETAKLIVKAQDLDGDDLNFSYSGVFTETKHEKVNGIWVSEATWLTNPLSGTKDYATTVTVTDTTGLKAQKDAPVIRVKDLPQAPQIQGDLSYTPPNPKENDPTPIILTVQAQDLDGSDPNANEQLTFSADKYFTALPGYPKKEGSLWTWKAAWQTDYNSSKTPAETITVTVTDSTGLSDKKSVTIPVENVNRPPSIDSLTLNSTTVNEDGSLDLTIKAKDLDGDNLTFKPVADDPVKIALFTGSPEKKADGFWYQQVTIKPGFGSAGNHTITVIVDDGNGGTDKKDSGLITVIKGNQKPVLEPIPAKTINEGDRLTLVKGVDLKATDPDGDAVSFIFDKPLDAAGTWQTGYKDAGTYNIKVWATDGSLQSIPQEVKVTVVNAGPYLKKNIETLSWKENEAKANAINLGSYFSNPDQDPLTYTVIYNTTNHQINASINSDNSVSFSQTPGWSGTENITFKATDSVEQDQFAVSNPVTLQVIGVNHPPQIQGDLSYTPPNPKENDPSPITLTVQAQDLDGSDPNANEQLTFSADKYFTALPGYPKKEGSLWTWKAAWQTDYNSSKTPAETITVTVTDSTGLSDKKSVTIPVENVNRPPVLEPIPAKTINEGEKLTLVKGVDLKASDPDGDAVDFKFDKLIKDLQWQTTYNDAGTYDITVTATDGKLDSLPQVLRVTVVKVNRPPVLEPIPAKTINEGDRLTLVKEVDLKATDPDGDAVSFIFDKPLDAAGTWQTGYKDAGTYNIKVWATDGSLQSIPQEVKVTVIDVNHAPAIESVTTIPNNLSAVKEGDLLRIIIKARDAEDDEISFSCTANPDIAFKPKPKTKEAGYWLQEFDWQTNDRSGGNYTLNLQASDGRVQSLYSNISLIVSGPPPGFSGRIPDFSWLENEDKINAFNLDDYFSSPDGDALSYSYTFTKFNGNTPQINVDINPATHQVTFRNAQGFNGRESLIFKATAENQTIASNEINLEVKRKTAAPVIKGMRLEPETIKEEDVFKLTVSAEEPYGGIISFNLSASGKLTLQSQTTDKTGSSWVSTSTWKAEKGSNVGTNNITITASGPSGQSVTEVKAVNVTRPNTPPRINSIKVTPEVIKEGDMVTIIPDASDDDGDRIDFYYKADSTKVDINPTGPIGQWLTNFDDEGVYKITVTASDGIHTVQGYVTLQVNDTPRPPSATLKLDKYTAAANEQLFITLTANDPDADSESYIIRQEGKSAVSGAIKDNQPITLSTSFSGTGRYKISAVVTDKKGLNSPEAVEYVDIVPSETSVDPLMGDFNGDSLTDLGLYYYKAGAWKVSLADKDSIKAGIIKSGAEWLPNFGASNSHEWLSLGGDFDGDGKSDIAVYNYNTGELRVALSMGAGSFASPGTWLKFSAASSSWQPFTGNFNGDKYTDFGLYNKDTGEVRIALGTGTGFKEFTTWLAANDVNKGYAAMGGDFNGDSLTDLGLFKKSSGEFKAAFSNNKEFKDMTVMISNFAVDKEIMLADFNNDGLTDIGYWDKSNTWYYAISTGAAFTNMGVWLSGFGASSDEYAATGDFDGNGITDAAVFDRDARGMEGWRIHLSTDKPSDFLVLIDNGTGGKTQVEYDYAAEQENNLLPFPVYVVKNIKLINTIPGEQSYVQEFLYSDGYYDARDREFRGFGRVKVSDPLTNNYTITEFYQGRPGEDGALKGQIKKISAYDGNIRDLTGQLISETVNKYEVKKGGPVEKFLGFPALVEQSTTIWEENRSWVKTRNTTEYDGIGNVLKGKEEEVKLFANNALSEIGKGKVSEAVYAPAYERGFNRPLFTYLKDRNNNIISQKAFEYDQRGNPSKETLPIFNPLTNSIQNATTSYGYDNFGNLITVTNAKNVTLTTYYETTFYAFPERVVNSLGHTVSYEYDQRLGLVTKTTDSNNNISETVYDGLGRVTAVKNAYQQIVTEYAYPDFNTKITTQAGLTATEYLDGLGRKYRTVSSGEDGDSPRQVASETYYNVRGQLASESLPHYLNEDPGKIAYLRYVYDTRGRIKRTITDFPSPSNPPAFPVTLADNERVVIGPGDAYSEVTYVHPLYTETIDPEGHKKGVLKDAEGNNVEINEFIPGEPGDDPVTTYAYDLQNNLTEVKDRKRNITKLYYDSAGRKLKMIDPDMGEWNYKYDILGNLQEQADAKGQVLKFEYDALNRLIHKLANGQTIVSYIYDEPNKDNCIGRLSRITYPSNIPGIEDSAEFFYDKLGRELKSIKTVKRLSQQGAVPETFAVERTYDQYNRLETLTYPDKEAIKYGYNKNSGLLETVSSLRGSAGAEAIPYAKVAYNAKGQIKTVQYGNGVRTAYDYGNDLRLSHIDTKNAQAAQLQDLYYSFDRNGNLLSLSDNIKRQTRSYTYDGLDRLKEANNTPLPGGSYGNLRFEYDSIGNMITKENMRMEYGVNAGPHAVTRAGGYSYQYDKNGNMTAGKNKTLDYDIENRLVKVTEPSAVTEFLYDGDGGRVKKRIADSVERIEKETIYIGSLFEKDSDGKLVKHIFAGANRICSISSSLRGGTTGADEAISYYHTDHLGSSNVITDQSGSLIQRCEYLPYGSVAQNEGSDAVKYKFTGKELDSTGLYFYGARYYDPQLGRFITPDTIVQAPYDPQSLNRYSYCRNNPINYVDPTGHKWNWKKFWHAAAGVFVGVVATLVLGPGGALAWYGWTMASIIGGALGGAVTGGLDGGWKGALIGAAIGGAMAGIGAWGVREVGWGFTAGMFAAGAGMAGATNSWDSFAGGITGALAGTAVGNGINSFYNEFTGAGQAGVNRNDLAAQTEQLKQSQRALDVKLDEQVRIGSRDAVGPADHMFIERQNGNIVEMGGEGGKIKVFQYNPKDYMNPASRVNLASTQRHTLSALYDGKLNLRWSDPTMVSSAGLNNLIKGYGNIWSGAVYAAGSNNSNYFVNTCIYGAGGQVTGLDVWRPSFSTYKDNR